MQLKMDQQSNPQSRPSVPSITKLAEKHSEDFLQQVLHPRGIKVISDSLYCGELKSLQERLGSPDRSALTQALGDAFVEFDASKAVRVFGAMKMNGENEAMHEAEYRKYFLKSGFYGNINTVCCCIQKKMVVEGSEQRTWIPLPVVIDRRESGLLPTKVVWDILSKVYPGKVGDTKSKDKYFIPDHLYAVNGKDEAEQDKIKSYVRNLPGFLLMKEWVGMKPPYLIQESRDHEDKEREARQYLSLLAASALHDRMLLRWLTDKAQADNTIALDRELYIYGMTCCGELVTLYKMSIRDIWSNPRSSKVGKEVRYDFVRVEEFSLSQPSDCTRLSDWMNILHYYGQTSLAESMMQDGEKAHSSRKFGLGDWKRQLSKIVFHYGKEPYTATFRTEHASIGNKDNKDGKNNKDGEGNKDGEDNEDGEDNADGEDNEGDEDDEGDEDNEDGADDAPPAPKRRKLSRTPCRHACRNQRLRSGRFCKHVCCNHGRERP
jgi:hypothetical protein